MTNRFKMLLSTPIQKRVVKDYEEVYDDFVNFAGGSRIDQNFRIPEKKKNADYYFDLDQFEIILELKQLTKYSKFNTVDQYFSRQLLKKNIKKFEYLGNNRIRINPDSLGKRDWDDFFKRFRPSVSDNLIDAAAQIKDTESFLPVTRKRRIKGVTLINSGDFNLSTDMLFKLTEWKTKREWKLGYFRSIDFVICMTTDMYNKDKHPLHSRYIARSIKDNYLVEATHYLHNCWLNYVTLSLGLEINYQELLKNERVMSNSIEPFAGKIVLNEF